MTNFAKHTHLILLEHLRKKEGLISMVDLER